MNMNELLVAPPSKTCDAILLQSTSVDVYHALTNQHQYDTYPRSYLVEKLFGSWS
jgi:hypothetical protein